LNTDIRLDVTFPDHPKTIALVAILGEKAVRPLLRLWTRAAGTHIKGDLTGLSDRQIELMAAWPGRSQVFVAALLQVRFLEGEPGARHLHDWMQRQTYAANSDYRTEKARRAAAAKWDKIRSTERDATSTAQSNAPSNAPAPAPSPAHSSNNPSPTPSREREGKFFRPRLRRGPKSADEILGLNFARPPDPSPPLPPRDRRPDECLVSWNAYQQGQDHDAMDRKAQDSGMTGFTLHGPASEDGYCEKCRSRGMAPKRAALPVLLPDPGGPVLVTAPANGEPS